jgi:hypothetical protein
VFRVEGLRYLDVVEEHQPSVALAVLGHLPSSLANRI